MFIMVKIMTVNIYIPEKCRFYKNVNEEVVLNMENNCRYLYSRILQILEKHKCSGCFEHGKSKYLHSWILQNFEE